MDNNQLAIITKKTIEGATSRDIEAITGLDHSTVARARQRPDIKAYIEAEGAKIIQGGLHIARKVILKRAAEGLNKSADDTTKDRSLKASVHITNMAGLSGQAPSTIVNALIYQGDSHAPLSIDAMHMVNKALGISTNLVDNDVIDLDGGSYGGMVDNDKAKT
uniref:Uncharacterized protein n=2 Tax=viral metagenome TaxID=1070528 RepID=A0A6H1Z7P4_9ZZZZ